MSRNAERLQSMRRRIGFLIGIATLACLPCMGHAAPKPVALSLTLDARATLFFQLECLARAVTCSRDEVAELWESWIGAERLEQIEKRWSTILDAYAVRVELRKPKPAESEWPDVGPAANAVFDIRWRIQLAMFSGDSSDVVQTRLSALMDPSDLRDANQIVSEAWPAFSQWWAAGEEKWRETKVKLDALAQRELGDVIREAAGFYQYRGPQKFSILLIPRPAGRGEYQAFQKQDQMVVEFSAEDDVGARSAVIAHEVCHYFFDNSPQTIHAQRMRAFSASPGAIADGAFGLMNEILATAIGNGLYMQHVLSGQQYRSYLNRKNSFYDDATIDAAAKALMPLVTHAARERTPFGEAFFKLYFEKVGTALGDRLSDPRFALRASQLYFTTPDLEAVGWELVSRYKLSSVYLNHWDPGASAQTMGMRFERLPIVILAHEDDYIGVLGRLVPGTTVADRGKPALLCRLPRRSGGSVYVLLLPRDQPKFELQSRVASCRIATE